MSDGVAAAADRCPRCGGGFACGMNGSGPCPCTTVTLSPALLADLRQRYAGCLCLSCLRELVPGETAIGEPAR